MLYLLLVNIQHLLEKLPLSFVIFLGKLLGRGFYYFSSSKRFNAYRNLKMVFPEKSHKEIFNIIKRSFVNFGVSIMETMLLSKFIKKPNYIRFNFQADFSLPGLMVGIHSGSWELYNAYFAYNHKFAVLVKRQKHRIIDRFLNEQRQKNKIMVCYSMKELMKYIKNGYWLGLMVDHGAEDNALWVNFFNKAVPTPKGGIYLAQKFDKKIYPMFGYRTEDGYHIIEMGNVLFPPYEPKKTLQRINDIYETFLRRYPYNYLWWFKRFKKKKNISFLILSDAKAGHFKQSLAFVDFFNNQGYIVEKRIVEVKPKGIFRRWLLEFFALCSSRRCWGCLKCLRSLLGRNTYKILTTLYADIVVSTGSSIAPVNLIVSKYLGAKSVVILKPNLGIGRFTMAVIPEHDRIKGKNVVNIKGALSSISNLEEEAERLKNAFSLQERSYLTLFIGGALEDERTFIDNLRLFLHQLKKFVQKNDYYLLVTSSRRSGKKIEEVLQEELGNFSHTVALNLISKANYPFIVGGFLFYAQGVFVSADSISMISESLSAHRPTIAVELEDISLRHSVFFDSLKGWIKHLYHPYSIEDRLIVKPQESLYTYNWRCLEQKLKELI